MAIPWAFQYARQFRWLQDTRNYLYRIISLSRKKAVLEPGCSIALITEEITSRCRGLVVGFDSDLGALTEAKNRAQSLNLVCGTVYAPPFRKEAFDAVIFQFFLLWLKEPIRALRIMSAMIQDGGSITAIAEPDYGGRIDFPKEIDYTTAIIEKLGQEGADPFVGRKLEYFFRTAMLQHVQWGLASIPFGMEQAKQHFEAEWKFLDLLSSADMVTGLKAVKTHEQRLLAEGKRSYFMPVFYCTAEKPKRY
jgi:ubiquinone/menaquinone biosynthesis C-methylase UbiE